MLLCNKNKIIFYIKYKNVLAITRFIANIFTYFFETISILDLNFLHRYLPANYLSAKQCEKQASPCFMNLDSSYDINIKRDRSWKIMSETCVWFWTNEIFVQHF